MASSITEVTFVPPNIFSPILVHVLGIVEVHVIRVVNVIIAYNQTVP